MIRKLKIKFIALSMTALVALLAVIVSGMNLISYNAVVSDADFTLSILSQNKGRFPDMKKDDYLDDDDDIDDSDDIDDDDMRKKPQLKGMSPELPFESRYFSVVMTESGEMVMTETSKIASVTPSEAVDYAKRVINRKSSGFIDSFRYTVSADGGNRRIIFLDCSRKLDSFNTFLSASIIMSLIGIAVVFLIICFFAGRIIRPIAESYEKQKQFITDAGHEIKTPLTVINANADLLKMDLGENECITDIMQQTERLKSLTEDLVTLARMEETGSKMQKIDFPISEVVEDAAKPFYNVALQQDKRLICEIQPMLSANGNGAAIQKLTAILLDNALKYSPSGSEIMLTLNQRGKTVLLTVSNHTVSPIEPQSLSHIFDRFYRTDESRNSQTGGHGIGLSIARSIVTAHGGKINAQSKDGSTFTITAALPT
ncbi:MAG: sensor histidine kinase [Acutalibacteraceae bacterium]